MEKINNITYPKFNIIYARDSACGIGKNNKLPWKIPIGDRNHFITWTTVGIYSTTNVKNYVIMGKNTYNSLCEYKCNMSNRTCIVISKSMLDKYSDGIITNTMENPVIIKSSLNEALLHCDNNTDDKILNINVIGGLKLYEEAINHPSVEYVSETILYKHFNNDTWLPHDFLKNFICVESYKKASILPSIAYKDYTLNNTNYKINSYYIDNKPLDNTIRDENSYTIEYNIHKKRISNIYESGYKELITRICNNGNLRSDRTGVGTYSLFNDNININIQNGFPLLTSRHIPLRIIAEELLWFIRGDTNAKNLQDKNVHIWDGNSSEEFLRSRGLEYPDGEIGPGYGYQWRSWGAPYTYTQQERVGGYDQLKQVITQLKEDPMSRRHVISAWNVSEINNMALPPCHLLYQFYVEYATSKDIRNRDNLYDTHRRINKGDQLLNCKVFMRSTDVMLGLPFNVASYSLLTILIAKMLNMIPNKVCITMTDTHIYSNHIEDVKKYLQRPIHILPQLNIDVDINSITDMETLSVSNMTLHHYSYEPAIKMPMAI